MPQKKKTKGVDPVIAMKTRLEAEGKAVAKKTKEEERNYKLFQKSIVTNAKKPTPKKKGKG